MNPPAKAGDAEHAGSDPWVWKILGGGNGSPLQYSCLENPIDRGAWQAIVHEVVHSRTRLRLSTWPQTTRGSDLTGLGWGFDLVGFKSIWSPYLFNYMQSTS